MSSNLRIFTLSFMLSFATASVLLVGQMLFPMLSTHVVSPIQKQYQIIQSTSPTEAPSAAARNGSDAEHSESTRLGM